MQQTKYPIIHSNHHRFLSRSYGFAKQPQHEFFGKHDNYQDSMNIVSINIHAFLESCSLHAREAVAHQAICRYSTYFALSQNSAVSQYLLIWMLRPCAIAYTASTIYGTTDCSDGSICNLRSAPQGLSYLYDPCAKSRQLISQMRCFSRLQRFIRKIKQNTN